MSNQSTIDALRAMRFSGMASELERQMKDCSGPVETAAKGPAETANLSSKEKAITKTFQTPYTG